MSLTVKPPILQQQAPLPTQRRLWKVPASKAWWLWLAFSVLLYVGIYVVYLRAIKSQQFPGPFYDPLRLFGIISFALVLITAAYSLRRRFMRGLPGKAQDWLWMHTWVGIITILIALLHSNFAHILNNYCQNLSCLSEQGFGTSALVALFVLIVSGVAGRLLDIWQTHTIAHEASSNGVGIIQALKERILELEYTVERLCAGKSEPFKQYCLQALDRASDLSTAQPSLTPNEQIDFHRAHATLSDRARLVRSLHKQEQARTIISAWRKVHIVLATLALCIIAFHSIIELLAYVLNVQFFQHFA